MSEFFDIEATLAKAKAMDDALFAKAIKDCRNADDIAFMTSQHAMNGASQHFRVERLRLQNDGVDRTIVFSAAAICLGAMYAELCRSAASRDAATISHYFNMGFSAGLGVSTGDDIITNEFVCDKTLGGRA